jgi:hypothetical protein
MPRIKRYDLATDRAKVTIKVGELKRPVQIDVRRRKCA